MGEIQLTYAAALGKGYPGQLADMNPKEIVSGAAEGNPIPFGYAVQKGTSDQQVAIASDGTFDGVAIRRHVPGVVTEHATQYEDEEPVSVLRGGYIYSDIDGTGAKGAALTYITTSGKLSTAAADGTHIVTRCKLDETIAAAGIALVRVAAPQ